MLEYRKKENFFLTTEIISNLQIIYIKNTLQSDFKKKIQKNLYISNKQKK